MGRFLLLLILMISPIGLLAQTSVSGVITTNTTWSKENSPYNIVGNIGISPNITLTIEGGVEVINNSSHEVLILGAIKVNGTPKDSVRFHTNSKGGPGTTKFLEFRKTNLSNSYINYAKFTGNQDIVLVSRETEHDQADIKVSGVLTFDHCYFENSIMQTNGYDSKGKLLIKNSIFKGMLVKGNYPRSEPIELKNCKFFDSEVYCDSYNYGIKVYNCYAKDSRFRIGCCGANFDIKYSKFQTCNFISENDNHDINISYSILRNTSIERNTRSWFNGQKLSLTKSVIIPDSHSKIYYQDVVLNQVNFVGNSSGEAAGASDSFKATNCSFYNLYSAIKIGGTGTVTQSNFIGNDWLIQMQGDKNMDAQNNYWESESLTDDIVDQRDDLNYGLVTTDPVLTQASTAAPLLAPLEVYKMKEGNDIVISWEPNKEIDIKGYKVYYKNFDGFDYAISIDAGASNQCIIPGADISESYVVTAYDTDADNSYDMEEGHESWYSQPAKEFFTKELVSQSYYCMNSYITCYLISSDKIQKDNKYTFELSDSNGSFKHPTVLKEVELYTSDRYEILIPDTLVSGTNYLMRIKSSNPEVYSSSDTLRIYKTPTSDFQMDSDRLCFESMATITYTGDGSMESSYHWDFNNAELISGDKDGPYKLRWSGFGNKIINLTVEENGCSSSSWQQLEIVEPVLPIPIARVSCNDENKNVVIWDSNLNKAYDVVNIYRESENENDFEQIGEVRAQEGILVDTEVDSDLKSYKYKISAVDTCSFESEQSIYHSSIHLVLKSLNIGVWQLTWNKYEGQKINSYHIYRGSTLQNMEKIASTGYDELTYTDIDVPEETVYYKIIAEIFVDNATNLELGSFRSISNFVCTDFVTSINDLQLKNISVWPNPVSNILHIRMPNTLDLFGLKIMTIEGKVVFQKSHLRFKEEIDLSKLSSGIYIGNLMQGAEYYNFKIIKK